MTVWQVAKLSSIAVISYGYTESASTTPVGPRFLRITDIQRDGVDWASVPFCPIDETSLSKFRLAHHDIVFARTGATTGKSFLVQDPPEAVFASYLIRLRLRTDELLPEFVNLFFQTEEYWRSIAAGSIGSAQGGFNASKLGDLLIKFPSVAAQQRIVAILDEAFEAIATAKANAEKNLRSAQALIAIGYQSIVAGFGVTDWVTKPVSALAEARKGAMRTGPFGSQLLHSEFVDEGIAVLGIDNAVANEFRWGERRYISESKYQALTRYRVYPGDVLITIMGTCGRCAVVPDDIPLAINTKHLCCITLDRQQCLPAYLHTYFLHDVMARQYLASQAKGSIMAGLNMGIISEMPVRLPPLSVQAQVVERFDELLGHCGRLADIQRSKLAALDELKKSLLHQAFTGQL